MYHILKFFKSNSHQNENRMVTHLLFSFIHPQVHTNKNGVAVLLLELHFPKKTKFHFKGFWIILRYYSLEVNWPHKCILQDSEKKAVQMTKMNWFKFVEYQYIDFEFMALSSCSKQSSPEDEEFSFQSKGCAVVEIVCLKDLSNYGNLKVVTIVELMYKNLWG